MHSVGLFGKHYLEIESRACDIGKPGHDDVIVKIEACGICGTDLNFIKQWTGAPMPLGHEIAGTVVDTGTSVSLLKCGDNVIVEDCTLCGTCIDCKSGRSDLCRNMFGLLGQSGMGQYVRLKQNSLLRYEGLSFVSACLTEPLAVCVNAVLTAEIPLQGSVVVLGCGPLGLMTARVAKLRGAGFVAITTVDEESSLGAARTQCAHRLGVDMVLNVREKGWEDKLQAKCPHGVDRVIVSSPPESLYEALRIVRYGGIVTFFGLHFGKAKKIELDMNDLIFRKITLRPFFAEPALNFSLALDLLKQGLVPANEIVTHTYRVSEAKDAFRQILDRTSPIIKAIVLPSVA